MAFIKDTTREKLIKKTNQNYGLRKFLISIEIAALIGYIVMCFVSFRKGGDLAWFSGDKLTGFGIGMVIWSVVLVGLGLVCLILTFTIRSPKSIKKDLNTLQSSALSGKRIKSSDTAPSVNRDRTTSKKDKEKAKK